jgi:hypothetical protein
MADITRREFEMTEDDLAELRGAMRSVPYIVANGTEPRNHQECVIEAWAWLGEKLGFDPMTARPNGQGDRFFSAVPV